jgi:hypothetical protein
LLLTEKSLGVVAVKVSSVPDADLALDLMLRSSAAHLKQIMRPCASRSTFPRVASVVADLPAVSLCPLADVCIAGVVVFRSPSSSPGC